MDNPNYWKLNRMYFNTDNERRQAVKQYKLLETAEFERLCKCGTSDKLAIEGNNRVIVSGQRFNSQTIICLISDVSILASTKRAHHLTDILERTAYREGLLLSWTDGLVPVDIDEPIKNFIKWKHPELVDDSELFNSCVGNAIVERREAVIDPRYPHVSQWDESLNMSYDEMRMVAESMGINVPERIQF